MPLLWRTEVIGWVNCTQTAGRLDVQAGFVDRKLAGMDFRHAFDAEVTRMKAFLVVARE